MGNCDRSIPTFLSFFSSSDVQVIWIECNNFKVISRIEQELLAQFRHLIFLFGSAVGGNAGRGAAAGALVGGGIRGSSSQSRDRDQLFRIAFDDCMRGRI